MTSQTDAQLITAAADNHTSWFLARCCASGGNELVTRGIRWLCSPADATIPFPDANSIQADTALEEIMETCNRVMPTQIACWTATDTQSTVIGTKLMARGFEWGWQPRWMVLDLPSDFSEKPLGGVYVHLEGLEIQGNSKLPYFNDHEEKILAKLVSQCPQNTWRFVATEGTRVVGHAVAHVATSSPQVVGIYSVGVDEEYRARGIGRALTLACAEQGTKLGCQYAMLNAANPFYEKFGFRTLGYGQTWWMHAEERGYVCDRRAVKFAEAVATGDLVAVAEFAVDVELFTQPLRCGLNAVGLAAQFSQKQCGEWLVNNGANYDILALWDLELVERIREMLHVNPGCVNQKVGRSGATPLHLAVMRNQTELARLLLAANPDLTITDDEAHSTPLGWATYFQRHDIAELIEKQKP